LERRNDSLTGVNLPFAGNGYNGTLGEQRPRARSGGKQAAFPGPIRDYDAAPTHQPVAEATAHLLLLRAEEVHAWSLWKGGQHVERVGPTLVGEAQNRRSGR
jgi:hypothetical protein